MTAVEVLRGDGPVVLAMPHAATWLPDDVAAALNPRGRALSDTDWHIDTLYDGLLPGATVVRATFHRYLIDANRDPSGASLYPGRNTTGLVPLTDFDGQPIWRAAPDVAEIARRREAFHAPYHRVLAAEMDRVRAVHGAAILYDCHSIRSEIPFLFHGRLAELNIGTDDGRSCAPEVERAVAEVARAARPGKTVLNARFKGGWTTRHYGRRGEGWHAVQMEIAQRAYMEEAPPWHYRPDLAGALRETLAGILSRLAALAPTLGERS